MASPTKKLKVRRQLRKAKMARGRKNQMKNHGSTPKLLPLDKPNANEKQTKA